MLKITSNFPVTIYNQARQVFAHHHRRKCLRSIFQVPTVLLTAWHNTLPWRRSATSAGSTLKSPNMMLSFHSFQQLSPGREHDIDMEPQGTQSQDCEPTPPLQRHGSKTNFFLPPIDSDSPRHNNVRMFGQARYSPHPRQRYALSCGSY